jgi:hypothetical protein
VGILRTFLNFGVGLAGGKVQLAVWAVVIVGGGIYIANHQRVVKEKAMVEQRNYDLQERAKAVGAVYDQALKDLEIERAKLAVLKDSRAKERAALVSQRDELKGTLLNSIADLAAKETAMKATVEDIPDSAVNAYFRGVLARARSAEIDRAKDPGTLQ